MFMFFFAHDFMFWGLCSVLKHPRLDLSSKKLQAVLCRTSQEHINEIWKQRDGVFYGLDKNTLLASPDGCPQINIWFTVLASSFPHHSTVFCKHKTWMPAYKRSLSFFKLDAFPDPSRPPRFLQFSGLFFAVLKKKSVMPLPLQKDKDGA